MRAKGSHQGAELEPSHTKTFQLLRHISIFTILSPFLIRAPSLSQATKANLQCLTTLSGTLAHARTAKARGAGKSSPISRDLSSLRYINWLPSKLKKIMQCCYWREKTCWSDPKIRSQHEPTSVSREGSGHRFRKGTQDPTILIQLRANGQT